MPERADQWSTAISLQELQDIVDRLGEGLGEDSKSGEPVGTDEGGDEADAILDHVRALRVLMKNMGPKAPACFTDRIVAAALEIDPVPDPTHIHRLDD